MSDLEHVVTLANHHTMLMRGLLFLFYRWQSESQRLGDLLKVTQAVNGRTGSWVIGTVTPPLDSLCGGLCSDTAKGRALSSVTLQKERGHPLLSPHCACGQLNPAFSTWTLLRADSNSHCVLEFLELCVWASLLVLAPPARCWNTWLERSSRGSSGLGTALYLFICWLVTHSSINYLLCPLL